MYQRFLTGKINNAFNIASNDIIFDILGMCIAYGGGGFQIDGREQTKKDIKDIAQNYADIIKFDGATNKVLIDFDLVKNKFIKDNVFDQKSFEKYKKAALQHKGIKLLNDLISDGKTYFYSTAFFMNFQQKQFSFIDAQIIQDWKDVSISWEEIKGNDGQFFICQNISINKRGDEENFLTATDNKSYYLLRPPVGIDGMVVIPATICIASNGAAEEYRLGGTMVPRVSFVFHELLESYLRTSKGIGYTSAHSESILAEGNFYGNDYPGQGGDIIVEYEK